MMSITIIALLFCMVDKTWAFSSPPQSISKLSSTTAQYMFFADTPTTSEDEEIQSTSNVQVQIMSGSDESMIKAAQFMVESFWLGSPQQLLIDESDVSKSSKASLISIQADDLIEKYGERMTSRKLDALVLAAVAGEDTDDIMGLTTLEVRLLQNQKDILSAEQSEFKLTQAVASLGPKQRREYKDASVFDIANQLLSPDITAILGLSNLCVADKHRRKGVAAALCKEAERVAKQELGFDEMYLRVEVENDAAKRLYETKLGYESVFEAPATVLRVDGKRGGFVELENADIAVLKKKI